MHMVRNIMLSVGCIWSGILFGEETDLHPVGCIWAGKFILDQYGIILVGVFGPESFGFVRKSACRSMDGRNK